MQSQPKARSVGRRRGSRKGRVAMAPASMDTRDAGVLEGDEGSELCRECLGRGERNALQCLQINDDVAVLVCDSDKCTFLPTLAPGSQLVIERRAADLNYLRRRKRRASSLPSSNGQTPSSTNSSLAKEPSGSPGNSDGSPSGTMRSASSPLPVRGVIQWPNEGQLCWLDVSMLLLVACGSLRHCHQTLHASSLLKRLCSGFDEAQRVAADDRVHLNKAGLGIAAGTARDAGASLGRGTNVPLDVLPAFDLEDLLRDELHVPPDFLEGLLRNGGETDPAVPLAHRGPSALRPSGESTTASAAAADILKGLPQNGSETDPAVPSAHRRPSGPSAQRPSGESTTASTASTADIQSDIEAAVGLLRRIRQEHFGALQPKLRCEEGKADSPTMALPLLLRLDGPAEEHFASRYRREFYCYSCGFTNVTIHRNTVVSLTATAADFSMQHPSMRHACPQCHAPGQTSRIVYHSMPACPLVHFSSGLSPSASQEGSNSWLPRSFKHQGVSYQLTCLIQYKRDPDHFVIWIRDPAREMWLECNDLSSPLCHWGAREPPVPPSEVHLLGWERETGGCQACRSLQDHMVEIEEAAAPTVAAAVDTVGAAPDEGGTGDGRPATQEVRRKSCPVVVQRSASPPTTTTTTTTTAREKASMPWVGIHAPIATGARSRPTGSDSAKATIGLLSIGTPPQSPEFSSSAATPQSDTGTSRPLGMGLDDAGGIENREAKKLLDVASQLTASSASRDNIEHSTVRTLRKTGQTAENKGRGSISSLLGELPKRHQSLRSSAIGSKPPAQNFSLAKMLRELLPGTPQQGPKKREKVVNTKQLASTAPPPTKIKKVSVPKRKYESFSAFKQNAGQFSSYVKKDSANTDGSSEKPLPPGGTSGRSSGKARNSGKFAGYSKRNSSAVRNKRTLDDVSRREPEREQADPYQSNALLTPSSSVSSPSACSESSLHSEATALPSGSARAESDGGSVAIVPGQSPRDLADTVDELYRALEITSSSSMSVDTAQQPAASSHMSAFLDDCTFLEELLS